MSKFSRMACAGSFAVALAFAPMSSAFAGGYHRGHGHGYVAWPLGLAAAVVGTAAAIVAAPIAILAAAANGPYYPPPPVAYNGYSYPPAAPAYYGPPAAPAYYPPAQSYPSGPSGYYGSPAPQAYYAVRGYYGPPAAATYYARPEPPRYVYNAPPSNYPPRNDDPSINYYPR
jgi:hypothetical protein